MLDLNCNMDIGDLSKGVNKKKKVNTKYKGVNKKKKKEFYKNISSALFFPPTLLTKV